MDPVRAELELNRHLYDRQIVELRLRRGHLPVIDRLDVMFPAEVALEGEPGDDVVVRLDAGEGSATVFTGAVGHIVRGADRVELTAYGGAARLAAYRPAVTFEGKTTGDVIRSLCSDVDVSVGGVDDGPDLAQFVTDGRSTAVEEVVDLAWLMGSRAAFDGDDKLHVSTEGPGEALALRYGREIVDMRAMTSAPDAISRVVVGEGAEAPGGSKALWVASDFLGGGELPGPEARRRILPRVRTTDTARLAGAAWGTRVGERLASVRLRTWLMPKLSPGARLEIADAPGHIGLSECHVHQVVHVLSARSGARSDAWGTSPAAPTGLPGGVP